MIKKCSKCQQELAIEYFSKDKYQKSGYRTACKACSAKEFAKFKASDGYIKRLNKTHEERLELKQTDPKRLWVTYILSNAKRRAKELNVEFSLTKEWLLANAVGKCPLLELELVYNASKSEDRSASIDRVDSAKGYTPENCKIVSFKANRIKNNATVNELLMLVKNIGEYTK